MVILGNDEDADFYFILFYFEHELGYKEHGCARILAFFLQIFSEISMTCSDGARPMLFAQN